MDATPPPSGLDLAPRRLIRIAAGVICAVAVGLNLALVLAPATNTPKRWASIQKAMQASDWRTVIPALRGWLERDPGDNRARYQLAIAMRVSGRESEAIADLNRMIEGGGPYLAEAANLLGEIYLVRDEAMPALASFRRAVELAPHEVRQRNRVISLLSLMARSSEYRRAAWELQGMNRNPRDLLDLTALDLDVYPEGRNPEAQLAKYLARSPADPWLIRARGLRNLRLGRTNEARTDLDAVADRIIDDPAGRVGRVECRLVGGITDPEELDRMLGHPPIGPASDRVAFQRLAARVARVTARPDRELAALRDAVATDPRSGAATLELGQALERSGETVEAHRWLEQAEPLVRDRLALETLVRSLYTTRDDPRFAEVARLCESVGLPREARGWAELALLGEPNRADMVALLDRLPNPTPEPFDPPKLAATPP